MSEIAMAFPVDRITELHERIAVLEKCIKEQHEINETMIATIEIILETLREEGHE